MALSQLEQLELSTQKLRMLQQNLAVLTDLKGFARSSFLYASLLQYRDMLEQLARALGLNVRNLIVQNKELSELEALYLIFSSLDQSKTTWRQQHTSAETPASLIASNAAEAAQHWTDTEPDYLLGSLALCERFISLKSQLSGEY
ncbi:hypothetical protein [Agaribacterium sp. ZY112]|uniref:hypothetical protein n=1 Tax=Agaribacterium sp. ZY112 TaxID=3233574 RepID=UPI0035255D40